MKRALPLLRDPGEPREHAEPAPRAPLGRRELIRWLGAVAAAQALPACDSSGTVVPMPKPPPGPPQASFFTETQKNALAALADYLVPPDKDPGGAELGVVTYVESLLTALDGKTEMVFAGGPYSGRKPFATADGAPSTSFPPDSFKTFVPLDRYRQAAWKTRLFGSSATPGGPLNVSVLGMVTGMRDQVKQALDTAAAATSTPLSAMSSAADRQKAFDALAASDKTLITELVIEGCFSTPEYGGNANMAGFKMCNFPGDVQPLGYSLFDEKTGKYNELPDAPVSTADPGPDPDPMDDRTRSLLKTLITITGGKVYY